MIVYERGSVKKGHGYKMCSCQKGEGIFDSIIGIIKPALDFVSSNKELIKNVGETVGHVATVGKNTRQIINSIRNKPMEQNLTTNERLAYENKDLKDVIKRINRIRIGEGFKFT